MESLVYESVTKVYPGGVVAVDAFDLCVQPGEMMVLVGPSGCGKTTVLRMTAGLETLSGGSIRRGDLRLDTLEPRDRDIAMVFQNYALYPHMTVEANLSFGLRLQKRPRAEIRERVRDVAHTLEIADLLARRPAELSGGQRQRVALGRAVIRRPTVYLFDEPLSNLDARLRGDMRAMIRRLYEELRVTSIYVTHDQVEAMTIGERLVVMDSGRVRQVGTPRECYERPADTFVATFLGSPAMNLFSGDWDGETRSVRLSDGTCVAVSGRLADSVAACGRDGVTLGIRPEDLTTTPSNSAAGDARIEGRVFLRELLGHESLVHARAGKCDFVARGTALQEGADGKICVGASARRVHLYSRRTGRRLSGEDTPGGGGAC